MTVTSYPITGVNLTGATWRAMHGAAGGVIGDTDGNAGGITFPTDSSDNLTVTPHKFAVNGFVGEVTADQTLNIPAVTAQGGQITYLIGWMYDPAKEGFQVANGDPQDGPLNLEVHPSGQANPPAGGSWWNLQQVTRTQGILLKDSAGTKVDRRRWVGPHYHSVSNGLDAPNLPPNAPRGSTGEVDGVLWAMQRLDDGTLDWVNLDRPQFTALPLSGTSGTFVAGPTNLPPQCGMAHGRVYLYGSVARPNGTALCQANQEVTIGTLPVAMRPNFGRYFVVGASMAIGTAQTCRVQITNTGDVIVFNQQSGVSWVDLSNVSFFP